MSSEATALPVQVPPSDFQVELERALYADLGTKLSECLNMATHLRRWDVEAHLAKASQAIRSRVKP